MQISEPMTLLTDWLLAVAVFVMAVSLILRGRGAGEPVVVLWGAGFVCSALAAFCGGAYHGFGPLLGEPLSRIFWKATVYPIGLAGFFMALAMVRSVFSGSLRKGLAAALVVKFSFYALWMAFHDDFLYVIIDYAPDLLLILLLSVCLYWKRRDPAASPVAVGVLLSFAAAAIQQSGVDLHRYFNRNDLYHLVQLVAFVFLYRGGLRLREGV